MRPRQRVRCVPPPDGALRRACFPAVSEAQRSGGRCGRKTKTAIRSRPVRLIRRDPCRRSSLRRASAAARAPLCRAAAHTRSPACSDPARFRSALRRAGRHTASARPDRAERLPETPPPARAEHRHRSSRRIRRLPMAATAGRPRCGCVRRAPPCRRCATSGRRRRLRTGARSRQGSAPLRARR